MSDQKLPSLTRFFGTGDNDNEFDFSKQLNETTDKIGNIELAKDGKTENSEPEVCRLFAETSVQSKDPTAAFFDLIRDKKGNGGGILSDLEIPMKKEDTYMPQVSTTAEVDRRRDAWIPVEKTRQAFIALATGNYTPHPSTLTTPGVTLEEELTDTVAEAVGLCLGEAEATQRRILTANDVTQDERGLRELVQAGSNRAAINLTARLLAVYGQGKGCKGSPTKHSPHSLQLWYTRIALLIKAKLFNVAEAEAEAFEELEKPDVFYQWYPDMYLGRSGSMASFSFRLLLAELPMHCGKPKDSLPKLFSVLDTVNVMLGNLKQGFCEDGSHIQIGEADRNDSIKLWTGRETRVMHSIINCALKFKDYDLAMGLLKHMCDREGAPKQGLLSALGRLHLQIGDIAGAETCFAQASQLGPSGVRDIVDRGLLCIAQNHFDDAYNAFQQASNLEPSNIMILNNMSVCLLYGGQLKEAIAVLEAAIASYPIHALHESLILNLCTLYDMESSKGITKKFALLKQISKYSADAPTAILEKLYG